MPSILDYCKDQPEKTFAAGEVLLQEGRRAGILYVLIDGEVEIVKRDVQINVVSDRGAIFGEISVLLNVPHMATVRACKPSRLYVIDKARRFLEIHPELAFHIAKLLGQRLRLVTTYLVDLKKQFEQHEDHLGMVDEVLESLVHHQGED
jgi:CRP-like cAMP-binding protein